MPQQIRTIFAGARLRRGTAALALAAVALLSANFATQAQNAAPNGAKDELVIGLTQYPTPLNPLIGSMLAKSVIINMTTRPLINGNDCRSLSQPCYVRARMLDNSADVGSGPCQS